MDAAILAIGSELLGVDRVDTNSLRLARVLERRGVELVAKSVVADDPVAIARELARRLGEVDLVMVTGGLGPTADDVTRPAAAEALGRPLSLDATALEALERRFERYGRPMPASNRRQAERIEGAELLHNPRGSAPGQRVETDDSTLFLFPGVPSELEAMIETHLEPWLATRTDDAHGIERRVLKVACRPESEVESLLGPAYERFGRESISVLASPGEIRLVASAAGESEARRDRLAAMIDHLAELVGDGVYTRDEHDTLESVVGRLLAAAGQTVTTAESCTGGLLAQRLTAVAGSSAYFLGGVVSYSNELKHQLLGVPREMLEAHGAVSEPVARAMATGVRDRLGSDWGVGITGVAGPGGGSDAKPVGTVHLAVAGPGGVLHRKPWFAGDRDRVRGQSAQWSLDLLRRLLLGDLAGDDP